MLKATYANHCNNKYICQIAEAVEVHRQIIIIIVNLFGFMFYRSLPCAFVDTRQMHLHMSLKKHMYNFLLLFCFVSFTQLVSNFLRCTPQ